MWMNDLLKLSIEELEHILALAPYSELHQMAYAIKKNQHDTGSMYQLVEGNYHSLKATQDRITSEILNVAIGEHEGITASDENSLKVVDFNEASERKLTSASQEDVLATKEKKPKTKKAKPKIELIKSEEINLVGDVSSFVLPDKTKKKRKKDKHIHSEDKKSGKKTKKIKSKKKKVTNKEIIELPETDHVGEDISGLSDFSTWLLSHSKESHIHPLGEDAGKRKKKKKKIKVSSKKGKKKDKSKKAKKSEGKDLIYEPLADLLAEQGHSKEAIAMYEKLSLIFPEKNAFFAAKIENIQKEL